MRIGITKHHILYVLEIQLLLYHWMNWMSPVIQQLILSGQIKNLLASKLTLFFVFFWSFDLVIVITHRTQQELCTTPAILSVKITLCVFALENTQVCKFCKPVCLQRKQEDVMPIIFLPFRCLTCVRAASQSILRIHQCHVNKKRRRATTPLREDLVFFYKHL